MSPYYSSAASMSWADGKASIERDHLALAEQLRHCHRRRRPWRSLLGACERAQAFAARRTISLLLLALALSTGAYLLA